MKRTFSTCYMCTQNCPIIVDSEGEEIVSIDHPDCVRATAMLEQREAPGRILRPRLRADAPKRWRELPLGDALDRVAEQLLDIRERHGPASVVFAAGYTKEVRPYLQRLAYSFGSPHYITESSCCFASGYVAAAITLGREYGYFLGPSRARSPATRCRLVWSTNPAASQIPYARHHLLSDADTVPTILVDPRRTSLARAAEVHLQLRPGTDGALALGLAHVIISEGLHDRTFVARHAHGFDAYRRLVTEYPPARVAEITRVPAERVVTAARLYGLTNPAQITISPNATTHHSNGFQNHRAILLLAALCGNLDVEGGNRPWDDRLKEGDVSRYGELRAGLGTGIGDERFGVFTAHYPEGQGMVLADWIERGQIRAVVSVGLNVMMWPNSERLARALGELELFVASDFFDNPTTDLATVVFPAATHLERQALIVAGNGRVQVRPAAVAPRGEAIGDTELLFALAARLGLGDDFWGGSIAASYDERLATTGFRFEDLPRDGRNVRVELPRVTDHRYREHGFGTPTGKVEFASTVLEEAGLDALPLYREPHWSPVSAPEVARSFPLILTSGGRSNNYTHSQGRELPTLREREPEPRVELHPDDAAERGIRDGDRVRIRSPLGSIRMRAWLSEQMARGVVHAPHGWATANVNTLIPDDGLDPISGFPPFKSSLCSVEADDGGTS